jgi:predicted phage baseplate assembly protein
VVLDAGGVIWDARRDLIGAGDQTQFVAEVDNDGRVSLRFGRPENDGTFRHGRTPADTDGSPTMEARYRTGVGPAGNVGAGAIRRIVQTGGSGDDLSATLAAAVESIGNPLPAWGGVDPEPIEDVRQIAPFAFAVQERAVTAADYARRAEQFRSATFGGVQRAVARMRWTGAWYTVFVAVDRTNGVPIDDAFEQELRLYLDRYRMSGHDIEIEGAVDVPLEITLEVTVERSAFRSVVLAELRDVLSNRRLVDGRTGLFHPDRLTFAQTVHLSPILAEAQAVPGVIGVRCIRFGPYRRPTIELRDTGYLEVGRNEIARLDNDPSRPDRGVLTLTLIGGR